MEQSDDTLPNQQLVHCFSYFPPSVKNQYKGSSKVISKTIQYLSTHVGDYPYKHASVVAGHLLAGGGMEYPNVTVIGKVSDRATLQTVIIHEVGHNWFYGILGSNERDHPWMDEGINSFYEKVIDKKIKSESEQTESNLLAKLSGENLLYPLVAMQEEDQAIEGKSAEYTKLNYGGIVYEKTGRMFQYLNDYLGDDLFEKCMKSYFEKWKFKHPYPQDIRAVFETTTGKDLSWFFDDGINSTKKIDFAIHHVQFNKEQIAVSVKNKTNFTGPVSISVLKKDSIIETKWIEYPYQNAVYFQTNSNDVDKVTINANESIPELKILNNEYRKNALFHKSKWNLRLGSSLGIKNANQVFLLPSFGYNYYDQWMLGLLVHNIKLPNNRFQYALAPMYSFATKEIVGTGVMGYSFFTKSLHKLTFAIQGKSFHNYSTKLNIPNTIYSRYIKIAPSLSIDFREKIRRSPISNTLLFKYFSIWEQNVNFSKLNKDSVYKPYLGAFGPKSYGIVEFQHKNSRTLNPYSYNIKATIGESFLKLGLTGNLKVNYHLPDKAFYVRGFLGKYFDFQNTTYPALNRRYYLNASSTASYDFLYEENYLSRNQQNGFMTQQITMEEGGMKVNTGLLASPIGENDNWLGAVNLVSDIPLKLPVKLPFKLQLFFDACTYANAGKLNVSGQKAVYDAGVQLNMFNGMANLYVPLLMSKDYKDYGKSIYGNKRFSHNIAFSLNFSKLNFLKTQNIVKLF
ncbi:MAG: putative Zn-dependent aminopeptidase [Bacteroidetes bacterium OLB11]|nr:MAG: putative Zn-dependent aminopeptidase [Bacteroidetes bacterium OLB11]